MTKIVATKSPFPLTVSPTLKNRPLFLAAYCRSISADRSKSDNRKYPTDPSTTVKSQRQSFANNTITITTTNNNNNIVHHPTPAHLPQQTAESCFEIKALFVPPTPPKPPPLTVAETMDDTSRLVSELQQKLSELDLKVWQYRRDMASQFAKYAEDLLRDVPKDVSDTVSKAIAESMKPLPLDQSRRPQHLAVMRDRDHHCQPR